MTAILGLATGFGLGCWILGVYTIVHSWMHLL